MPTPISTARTGLVPRHRRQPVEQLAVAAETLPGLLFQARRRAPPQQRRVDRSEERPFEALGGRLRQVRLQQRRHLLDRGIGVAQAGNGERRAAGGAADRLARRAGRRRRRRNASTPARPGAASRRALRAWRPGRARGQPCNVTRLGSESIRAALVACRRRAAVHAVDPPPVAGAASHGRRDIGRSSPSLRGTARMTGRRRGASGIELQRRPQRDWLWIVFSRPAQRGQRVAELSTGAAGRAPRPSSDQRQQPGPFSRAVSVLSNQNRWHWRRRRSRLRCRSGPAAQALHRLAAVAAIERTLGSRPEATASSSAGVRRGGDARRVRLLVGVVARAHQRADGRVREAHLLRLALEHAGTCPGCT